MARTDEEITFAIGTTVLRFAQIESMMGLLIAFQYANRESYPEFIADILADEGFSYGLRCNTVRKILVRNGLTEKEASGAVQPLRDLGGTRNLIAHAGKTGFAAGPEAGYLHPKKVGEVIKDADFGDLSVRFDAQFETAFEMLRQWVEKLSPYLREFRRLEAEVMTRNAEKLRDEAPPRGDSSPNEA